MDPNDTTYYKYHSVNDTLITSIFRYGHLNKVEKVISVGGLKVNISENYLFGHIREREIKYQWPDSTKNTKNTFNDKGKITSYYYTFSNNLKILKKNNDLFGKSIHITNIKTFYDKRKNWIKKEYYTDEKLTYIILRKIEYFED